jgi:hypothetical protein
MNSQKAKALFIQAKEDRRRAYFQAVSATRRLRALERRNCTHERLLHDAREEVAKARLKYLDADVHVGKAHKTMVKAEAFAKKAEVWVAIIAAGLICAVLFPDAGAIAITGGLPAYILTGIIFGAVTHLVWKYAPAVETLIRKLHCPSVVFRFLFVSFIALPLMAIWLLSLTDVLVVLSFVRLAFGTVVAVAGYFIFPRLLSNLF